MHFSPTDSNISSAEELTEDLLHEDNSKEFLSHQNLSDIEIIDENYKIQARNECSDSFRERFHIESSMNSPTIYSQIRPEHVRILDLHVDPNLKPDFILSNKDSVWLGTDRYAEENKRRGIIRYLSNDKPVTDLGCENMVRALSFENVRGLQNHLQSGRRGSLDEGLRRKLAAEKRALKKSDSGDWSQNNTDTNDDSDGHMEGEMIEGFLVDELEFKASLKNERYHFMFADQLTEALETVTAEEYFRRKVVVDQRPEDARMSQDTTRESVRRTSTGSQPTTSITFSNAETTALAFVDEIIVLLDQLTLYDGRQRNIPKELQSLITRLEKRCMLSQSFDLTSSHHRSHTTRTNNGKKSTSARYSDGQSTSTEAMIKAAIGNVTINLPVGGCPILGPDMSLPGYIVSRSPAPAKRSVTLSLQHNICPGCQSAFLPEVARRLRLCYYYCLYFCSVCHSNTLMLIPAHILSRWDFTMLPVSRPARDILQLIHAVPMFTIAHFSDSLRSSLRVLLVVSRLRRQGRLLLNFIEICRQGANLASQASLLPSHWFSDPPLLFSLADLSLMETGVMEPRVRDLVARYIEHVSLCPVCQARGFLCELDCCDHKDQVIFPFEIDLVCQCVACGACFHLRCYNKAGNPSCPRCDRRHRRQQTAATR